MRSYPTMLQAIGKVFLKDRYSAIYRLGEDGNVWYVSRTAVVNQGMVAEFREAIKGRTRFHPFAEGMESGLIRTENIIYNWKRNRSIFSGGYHGLARGLQRNRLSQQIRLCSRHVDQSYLDSYH